MKIKKEREDRCAHYLELCLERGKAKNVPCPKCEGNKYVPDEVDEICKKCNGKGYDGWKSYYIDSILHHSEGQDFPENHYASYKKSCENCSGKGRIPKKFFVECPKCKATGFVIKL